MRKLAALLPLAAAAALAVPATASAAPPFLKVTPKGKIGAGRWRVVARLRCESGEDGSPNFFTRKRRLRILL